MLVGIDSTGLRLDYRSSIYTIRYKTDTLHPNPTPICFLNFTER